jgi:hypothetical protein
MWGAIIRLQAVWIIEHQLAMPTYQVSQDVPLCLLLFSALIPN